MLSRIIPTTIFFICWSFSSTLMAQTPPDSIQIINVAKNQYQYKEATLGLKQIVHITVSNIDAYESINKAIDQRGMSRFMGFTGGSIIGFVLGTALVADVPTWWPVWFGIGFVGFSAVLSDQSNKNAHRGVMLHNAGLKDMRVQKSGSLRLGMCSNGLGVSWQF